MSVVEQPGWMFSRPCVPWVPNKTNVCKTRTLVQESGRWPEAQTLKHGKFWQKRRTNCFERQIIITVDEIAGCFIRQVLTLILLHVTSLMYYCYTLSNDRFIMIAILKEWFIVCACEICWFGAKVLIEPVSCTLVRKDIYKSWNIWIFLALSLGKKW